MTNEPEKQPAPVKSLSSIMTVFSDAVSDLRYLVASNDAKIVANSAEIDALRGENTILDDEAATAEKYAKSIEKNILGKGKGFF